MEIKSRRTLEERIIFALADDEEYLEEIYLDVNFDLEEERRAPHSIFWYRGHRLRFRLAEILVVLDELVTAGYVARRTRPGFPAACGVAADLYSLTDLGRRRCEAQIRGDVHQSRRVGGTETTEGDVDRAR